MNWYLDALRKYAVFSGRARRKEYWYFALFNLLIHIGLSVIDSVAGIRDPNYSLGLLGGIYALAILIPSLAVSVRRLHDTDRSGWWLLIGLVPIIGGIVLLIFMVLDSQPGENRFGAFPKEEEATLTDGTTAG